jgi:high-affinity iron transporter
VRLPVGPFFGATSALLALLAVVLAGKGVAALQQAGIVPVSPVHGPALPALGLYPSAQGLALQAALMIAIAAGFALTHRAARRAA